jgi:hypothetical protein
LVGDGLSRRDGGLPRIEGDSSSWSVIPDWEHTRGLVYNLFAVDAANTTIHSALCECFKDECIFLEVIDALLGITDASTASDCKRTKHQADSYFIKDGRLWWLGGSSLTHSMSRQECVTQLEAMQLAREEHAKLHMHRDHIHIQLLD